jgi:hypothetical protein
LNLFYHLVSFISLQSSNKSTVSLYFLDDFEFTLSPFTMLPKLMHSHPFSPNYTPSCARQSIRRPPLQTNHLGVIMNESPWNANYTCPAPSSFDQVESPAMFPTINSRQAQESYPSPASSIPSPSRIAQQDALVPHDQSVLNVHEHATADCYSVPFNDSSADESRTLSGRVSRLEQRSQRRRDGFQSPYPRSSSGLSPVCVYPVPFDTI